jgi:hypothetical protein
MAKFWKIKKQDYWNTAYELKKWIPKLKNEDIDDLVDNLRGSNLSFVLTESVDKPFWIRLSLPFGLIVWLILFITLPIKFMVTGTWNYKWLWLQNWFSALDF